MKKAKTYMDFMTMSHRAAAREAADLTAQLLEVKAENAELRNILQQLLIIIERSMDL